MTPLRFVSFQLPSEHWPQAVAIRTAVFVDEQACPPEEEWDAYDATATHLIAMSGSAAVATARWRAVATPEGTAAKLERFAVLEDWRGRGIGRDLVAAMLGNAQVAGHTRFVLHAQAHLAGFYGSFGFTTAGPVFDEVGIPHVPMVRDDRAR
ncbi:MAG: GNAT family N-acetyltransferase [Bacteroidota bacterium]